jgi:hypothetical protein
MCHQEGMELNETHHILVCADSVNVFGKHINFVKKNTEALLETSREVGLEVNMEKSKYVAMSCHQNAGQNHNFQIVNVSLKNVAKFKYLEMTVINTSWIYKKK